jgi:glycosyltransferase involved in cell wall biosynthesis
MRILVFAGYTHPSQHRKIELLADEPDFEIIHLAGSDAGRVPGGQPSATGQRSYTLHTGKVYSLGKPGDPHRSFGWPPFDEFVRFRPEIVHYEGEVESLGAAEIVLIRALLARQARLVLTTWQNILRPRSLLVQLINDLNLSAATHILCASQEADHVLRQQGYRRATSILPIIGVDPSRFFPQPAATARERLGLGLDGFTIGYVGRLVPEKGVDDLLRAVARLTFRCILLIIGDGPARGALEALAAELGIAAHCRMIGPVPHEDLAGYLNALDLLVLPSRTTTHWKEQLGRVLLEAMACRIAVLGSHSGAIPEVIGDPDGIYAEGDVPGLAARIAQLAAEPEYRHARAESGYHRALERYSTEHLARATAAVWRSLAS